MGLYGFYRVYIGLYRVYVGTCLAKCAVARMALRSEFSAVERRHQ